MAVYNFNRQDRLSVIFVMEENLKNKAAKGAAWTFLGSTANKGIQFVVSLLLARLLTPDDYGLIGMLGIFIGVSETLTDNGFTSALIQNKNRTNKDYSTAFYFNFGMSVLVYLALYLAAPFIADFYNQPLLKSIVRVYCLSVLIGAFTAVNSVQLTIALDYKTSNILSTSSALASGLIGVICAFMGMGVWSLVVQQLSMRFIQMILVFIKVKWFPDWVFSKQSFKQMFGFGSKLVVSGLIHNIYSNMYSIVIGKQFKPADLGYVSRAQGFNQMLAGNINGVISSISFPVLSKIDGDERLMQVYRKYIQMSAFLVFPLIMFLCGVAKPLILFLLTEKWATSILLLQILSFSYIWDGIIQINLSLLYVKGRTDLVLRLEFIKKTIAFAILIISVLIGNLVVFCIGMALYGNIALFLNTIYTKKLLNYGFKKQMCDVLPYLFVSLFIMSIALFFSWLISNNLLSLVVSTVICIPTYFYICYRYRFYALSQIVELISPRTGRFGRWAKSKIIE